jgi:3'(2'), 5'-bisphosphate nucleotidase
LPAYRDERETALAAVRRAGRLCQTIQEAMHASGDGSNGAVRQKEDRSPVTVADFGSQALICRALAEAFPDDPVVGEEDAAMLRSDDDARGQVVQGVQAVLDEEEGEDADPDDVLGWIDRGNADGIAERYWTVDPIDGTKGFVRGDQYAVALALIVGGQVEVGVLGLPNFMPVAEAVQVKGLLVAAERGEGTAGYAAYEGADAAPTGVTVSPTGDPAEARFCESVESAHTSHGTAARVAEALGITREPLRVDSQAKYAMVARGDAEIYLRLPRGDYVENIWDHAAGKILVEEAGGTVTDLTGRLLDFSHGPKLSENRGIVATNGRFHDQVIAAIQEAPAE